MKNPYLRLLELTYLSQSAFGEKYGFAATTMSYISSGQYPGLSKRMIESLGKEFQLKGLDATPILKAEYGVTSLQEAYYRWKSHERWESRSVFDKEPREVWTDKLSPFHFYIKDTTGSLQGFAKALKVPSVSVLRYASGRRSPSTLQLSMPDSIERAFAEIGWPHMAKMVSMQAAWVQEHLS